MKPLILAFLVLPAAMVVGGHAEGILVAFQHRARGFWNTLDEPVRTVRSQ